MDGNQVIDVVGRQMPPVRLHRVGDPSRTRVMVDGKNLAIRAGGGQTRPVSPDGVPKVLKFMGLPKAVAARLQTRTLQRTATDLLTSSPSFSMVTDPDGQVTDLVKADMPPLPIDRVVRQAEKVIKGLDFHRIHVLEPHVVRLECVGTEERPVRKGDLVKAGALLHFSPLGTVEPMIQSYGLRMWCSNGAVAEEVIETYKRQRGGGGGEGDELWQWFRESIRQAYGSIGQVVNRYQALGAQRIAPRERAMALEGLLHQAGIQGEMADAVRARALENPPRNEYDLLNLLTHATSHILENPRDIARAQGVAAEFTSEDQHRRRCPTCRNDR